MGGELARMLAGRGCTVRALVLEGDDCPGLRGYDIEIFRGDVCHPGSLTPLFDAPGKELVVLHAAGLVSIVTKVRREVYAVNVTGTKNIIEQCLSHKVKKLVYVSSVHAIPEHPGLISEAARFSPGLVHGAYAKGKRREGGACGASILAGAYDCTHSGNLLQAVKTAAPLHGLFSVYTAEQWKFLS